MKSFYEKFHGDWDAKINDLNSKLFSTKHPHENSSNCYLDIESSQIKRIDTNKEAILFGKQFDSSGRQFKYTWSPDSKLWTQSSFEVFWTESEEGLFPNDKRGIIIKDKNSFLVCNFETKKVLTDPESKKAISFSAEEDAKQWVIKNIKSQGSDEMKKNVRASFRNAVFKRDKYTCQVCGKVWTEQDSDPSHGKLNAHHITDRSMFKNGGYSKENGITVCDGDKDSCHMKCEAFHISGGKTWDEGLHPNDLYKKINSSFKKALAADEK